MSKDEARALLNKTAFTKPQEKREREMTRMRDARAKHLYINPHAPIPNAAERIAEAIRQAEQTQRNIDALDKGETA